MSAETFTITRKRYADDIERAHLEGSVHVLESALENCAQLPGKEEILLWLGAMLTLAQIDLAPETEEKT